MPLERLQKILSRAGIASRREAEKLILSGQVSVNGKVIRELGTKADPKQDIIQIGHRRIGRPTRFHYYAYYKPVGVLVTKRDELGRGTIFDRLRLPKAVNSVGRLDKDSEGLLLLSDDGDFVQRYTHPSFSIPKIYQVRLSRKLNEEEKSRLMSGIPLEEKIVRAQEVRTVRHREGPWIELILMEGVKREVRRMLEFLDIKVLQLIRVQHGSVKLGKMRPGELRPLKARPL